MSKAEHKKLDSDSPNDKALKALAREDSGKSSARAMRKKGLIPAILYGGKDAPQSLGFDAMSLTKKAHDKGFMTKLVSIELGGKNIRAIPRETQLHPLTGRILHIDFMRLGADSRIDVEVAMNFINEDKSPGLKRGGVLNIVRHEVELSCPAESIPDILTANLEGLEIGDAIHISHIALPDKVHPTISDRDFTIATIAAPAIIASEEESEESAEAETPTPDEPAKDEKDSES